MSYCIDFVYIFLHIITLTCREDLGDVSYNYLQVIYLLSLTYIGSILIRFSTSFQVRSVFFLLLAASTSTFTPSPPLPDLSRTFCLPRKSPIPQSSPRRRTTPMECFCCIELVDLNALNLLPVVRMPSPSLRS